MSLTKKGKDMKKDDKVTVSKVIADEEGIKYPPLGITFDYPIYLGKVKIPSLSSRPVVVELVSKGRKYYTHYYDERYGLIAKAELPYRHTSYILNEMIERELSGDKLPKNGFIDEDKLMEIFKGRENLETYKR